jgi:serine/threonine protein kinase
MGDNMIIAHKYQITGNVGSGRFGSVLKGFCLRSGKIVAVKMEESDGIGTLRHEATVLHYLDTQKCTNIPQIYYYGLHRPNHICMVMSYYSEGSLDGLRPHLQLEEKLAWWNTALDVLEHIHKAGIVHRDIKPQHFVRDKNNEWNLIDFGLATSFLDESNAHIRESPKDHIVGSPKYVSWFVHGGRDVVRRDDFLSLIYVFWELLYGDFIGVGGEENKYSTDVLDEFNEKLREQKEFSRFYRLLEMKSDDAMVDLMVSLFSHAEELSFRDKPNYSLFHHCSFML